jgi:hypothetical protein
MYCSCCGARIPGSSRFCSSCGQTVPQAPQDMLSGIQTELVPVSVPSTLAPPPMQTELGLLPGFMHANRYCIITALGIGGMGRVYLAEDQKLGIKVGVKVLREVLSSDPAAVKRLIAEARHSIQKQGWTLASPKPKELKAIVDVGLEFEPKEN